MDTQRKKRAGLDNRGSAIVTVLVLIGFLSILTTVVLYSAGMNYIMKNNDVRVKKSFYVAETALEDIRAQLIEEVSYASATAYMRTMVQYAGGDAAAREYTYKEDFLKNLQAKWDDRLSPGGGTTFESYQAMMQAMVTKTYDSLYPGSSDYPQITCPGGIVVEGDHACIKNVGLIYTDADGYTTEIQTDFWIAVPPINWNTDQYSGSYGEGDSGAALERDVVAMADCVRYHNWEKK